MFMNEILNKTVKEENHAQELFEFILTSLISLDDQKKDFENFHLIFLIKLSRLLGFGAHHVNDVLQGIFAGKEEEELIAKLIGADYENGFALTNVQRRNLLDILLRFYTIHIDSLGEINSVQVLKEVLN